MPHPAASPSRPATPVQPRAVSPSPVSLPLPRPGHEIGRDRWLVAVLVELVGSDAVARIAPDAAVLGYWCAAVRHGVATDDAILAAAARRTGVVAAASLAPCAAACALVPERLARRHGVLPVGVDSATIEIATADPYDLDAEQTLGFATARRVRLRLASPLRIAERLDEAYRPALVAARLAGGGAVAEPALWEALADDAPETAAGDDGTAASDRPIVRLVDRIVAEGIATRASDVHLEAEEDGIAVRYRVDGVLRSSMVLPRAVGLPLVSRIKILARMDIADRIRPQGGRARVTVDGARIDLRVSTLPASHGEKVVIRILDPRAAVRTPDDLGLEPRDAGRLARLLDAREGLVLVTGPTGSGKTTTLYAVLQRLAGRGLNVVTVEDPVEYRVAGMVQVQVNERAGLTFAAALRSILRQDPDVILVGEIRDRETAAIALQAALTGHLVLATLHTIDACSSIARLQELGAEPAKVAAALKGVVAQRLVRRVCPACVAHAADAVPATLWEIVPTGAALAHARGCPACAGTGYRGRLAVLEVVEVTAELERLVSGAAPAATLAAAARAAGMRSLWSAGVARLLAGQTTAEELCRVLEPDERATAAALEARARDDAAQLAADGGDAYDSPDEPEPDATTAPRDARATPPRVTRVEVGVVDVYVVDPSTTPWRALALQRSATTRCPGAWEGVHGHIEPGEAPEEAALREVREETGLTAARLYNVTVHAFYLHHAATVELAVVFCAFASAANPVTPGPEHARAEWLALDDAAARYLWPRARQALREIRELLGGGDAGVAEDVLRVR